MPKTKQRSNAAPATKSVTLRIQSRKLDDLDRLAENRGTTRSALIQLAIADYVDRNPAAPARKEMK